jgi:4-cresol dehydrogenase (hydroxylating) flavoprotein subunit
MVKHMELVEQLRNVLHGSSQVFLADAKSRYLQNCEGISRTDVIVVQLSGQRDDSQHPYYLDEIPALLSLANQLAATEKAFSIYPISTGNNWGYGCALSPKAGAVILDLSQLQHIQVDDVQTGLITVEPGVTQQMLRTKLNQLDLPFMIPVSGAGPSCSLLANALERGYGITPYTDHFAAVNSIKGFLPQGQRYQSALSNLDGSGSDAVDKTFKWKLGPYLDGLFTQSNLAIATEVTLRLKKNPAAFDSFYLQFADEQDFQSITVLVRELLQRLEGVVGSVNIMDRRRVLSMMIENPNGPAQHQIMTEQQIVTLAKKHQVPAWTVVGTLYGEPAIVRAGRSIVRKMAKKADRVIFSESLLIRVGKLAASLVQIRLLDPVRKMLSSLDKGVAIMKGIPNQVALPLAYWRNPRIRPDDLKTLQPAIDQCGLLWYAPLVKFEPEAMQSLVDLVRTTCPKFGIEPMITFTSLRHDTVDSTIPVVFNRHDPAAVAQAHACVNALVEAGLKLGLVPYRLNILQQQTLLDSSATSWQWVRQIKLATDPNHVLSPGRYNP